MFEELKPTQRQDAPEAKAGFFSQIWQLITALFANVGVNLPAGGPTPDEEQVAAGTAEEHRTRGIHHINPVRTPAVVTSAFGQRDDRGGTISGDHHGLDIAPPRGSGQMPNIVATASGRVTFAGERGGYGNLIEITHSDGSRTRYGHLNTISVDVGQHVDQGDTIGVMGSTGRSTGTHLHYEQRDINNRPVRPKIQGEHLQKSEWLNNGHLLSEATQAVEGQDIAVADEHSHHHGTTASGHGNPNQRSVS